MDKEGSLSPRDWEVIGKEELWEYDGRTGDIDQANILSRSKWEWSVFLCHCRKHGGRGAYCERRGWVIGGRGARVVS